MTFSKIVPFLAAEPLTGISLDGSYMHVACVTLSGNKLKVIKLTTEPVKPLDNRAVISCLPSSKLLVRPLEIALTKPKDVDATYRFEAETQLPYPIDSCLLAKVTLSRTKSTTQLALYSALKTDLQAHLDTLKSSEIDPEAVCPKPLALCHFVSHFYSKTGVQIVLDIDYEETSLVLIKDSMLLTARSHPVGLYKLQQVTASDADGNVSINEDHLPFMHEYLREVSRILLSFQNSQESREISFLFTGPVVQHTILAELIATFLQKEVATCPEGYDNKAFSWNEVLAYAAPLGATLFKFYESKGQAVNFRQEAFAFSGKWRRLKRELCLYCCLMLALSGSLFIWSQAKIRQQERRLLEKYSSLLVTLERAPQEEELLALNSTDLTDKLSALEQELSQSKEEMALHPDVPRVCDLFAWLNSHPKVVDAESPDKSLSLESLTYTMVKRPEKGKANEHYQVRVDLEFSSPSATMAREFHDALLAPNAFVDPKHELKWSVHRGHYRASFFLKDRTKYPHQIFEATT